MFMNNRWEGLGKEVQRRTVVWSYVLSAWFYDAYFKKASQVRTKIIEEFENVFEEVDVLLTPPTPSAAWKLWEKAEDPLKLYLADAYTIPSSLAWLPWISVPAWFVTSNDEDKEELPVWVQLIAWRLNEQKLLEISNVYEQATKFGQKTPIWFED
jgi:aspartyl-tRNA(Asn)/glutamyl-tRNA(Gln) amidotransferase subunit A